MALAADSTRRTRERGHISIRGTNTSIFYAGALVGVDKSTGLAVKWADTANFEWLGLAKRKVTGDTGATPPTEVEVNATGLVLEDQTVTGLDNVNDQGDLVYATDDNTFTLTATANVDAIGFVLRFKSGTSGDIQLFTPGEHRAGPA
jgi:hypothetical protein